MARYEQNGPDGVTIVGGRPMRRAVPVSELPVGIEQLLTLAALDPAFLLQVMKDPVDAAKTRGIRLDETEAALLRGAGPDRLRQMADRLIVPKTIGRGTFLKTVAASIVAMVTGQAFLLCSGCTGADTWESDGGKTRQDWVTFDGYTCYLYVPEALVADPTLPAPIMVALHGEGETCLSNVQRWHSAADAYGFVLLSVNWNEQPLTDAGLSDLIQALASLATLGLEGRASSGRFLCSRGTSTPLAFESGLVRHALAWDGVVLLGGVPAGDWVAQPDQAAATISDNPPAVYFVLGEADSEFAQAKACAAAMKAKGVTCQDKVVAGTTSSAVLEFATIWQWISSHGRTTDAG